MASWSDADFRTAAHYAAQVLAGVGRGNDVIERGVVAMHWRRQTTPDEAAIVEPVRRRRRGL